MMLPSLAKEFKWRVDEAREMLKTKDDRLEIARTQGER
jgi:hypothetical protein